MDVRSEYADPNEGRSVYLTFDDGPHSVCTPDVLDVLAEYNAPATFFAIGVYASDRPELIRRIVAEGHEVANHTMSHPDLSGCEPDEVRNEILTASQTIRSVCPHASLRHIRAPYGVWTREVLTTSAMAGLVAVHWSVDPRDWSCPGVDTIVGTVMASVRPGAIVLLHDGCPPGELQRDDPRGPREQTVKALSRLIPAMRDRGFAIRPLPQPH
ncbi:chitooligosaccharide deacetylase NodB [Bradyrhizobium macuxiense]|uniref:chitooligosaccharide deacetylase NodB n=1 Tax=Bradyrhizobium macuxiense TaxID=1755647 RepID=UPI001FDA1E0E|nr:chitooligosaccharide deacetylase NodB [Bradyrhizobium macuxiense]